MSNFRTAVHEAGHAYSAWALGRPVGAVTVVGGTHAAGVTFHRPPRARRGDLEGLDLARPFVLWHASVRRALEAQAVVTAAGEAAEVLAGPAAARRLPAPLAERAADIAARLPPTPDERQRLADACDDDQAQSDAERLAALARAAHGDQLALAAAWLAFIDAQAQTVVTAGAPTVLRLASVLADRGTLSGRAVRQLLEDT